MSTLYDYETEISNYDKKINDTKNEALLEALKSGDGHALGKQLLGELGIPAGIELTKEGVQDIYRTNSYIKSLRNKSAEALEKVKAAAIQKVSDRLGISPERLSNLGGSESLSLDSLTNSVNTGLTGLETGVRTRISNQLGTLEDAFNAKTTELKGVYEGKLDEVKNAKLALDNAKSNITDGMTGAASRQANATLQKAQASYDSKLSDAEGLGETLNTHLGSLQTRVGQVLSSNGVPTEQITELQSKIPSVSDFQTSLSEGAAGIQNRVEAGLRGIVDKARTTATEAISGAATRVRGAVSNVVSRVRTTVGETVTNLADTARQTTENTIAGAANSARSLASGRPVVGQSLSDSIANSTRQIRETGSNLRSTFGEASSNVQGALADTTGESLGLIDRLSGVGRGALGEVVGIAPILATDLATGAPSSRTGEDVGIGFGINKGVEGVSSTARNGLTNTVTRVRNGFSDLFGNRQLPQMDDVESPFGSMQEGPLKFLRSGVQRTRDAIRGETNTATEVGDEVSDSFFQGIRNLQSFAQETTGLGRQALGSAQEMVSGLRASANGAIDHATGVAEDLQYQARGLASAVDTQAVDVANTAAAHVADIEALGVNATEAAGDIEAGLTGLTRVGDAAASTAADVAGGLDTAAEVAAETGGETEGIGLAVAGLAALGGVLAGIFGGGDDSPPTVNIPNYSHPVLQEGLGYSG